MIPIIIKRIENGKLLTKKMLEYNLPKRIKDKLKKYQEKNRRLDVNKLIRDLKGYKVGGGFCFENGNFLINRQNVNQTTPKWFKIEHNKNVLTKTGFTFNYNSLNIPKCLDNSNAEVLGEGSYGIVYSCGEIALKVLKNTDNIQDRIITNIKNLYALFNDSDEFFKYTTFLNIKKQVDWSFNIPEKSYYYNNEIIFPAFNNSLYYPLVKCDGSFIDYNEKNNINIYEIHKTIMNLFKALDLISNKGIINADIKPPNILYKIRNNEYEFKLTDFDTYFDINKTDNIEPCSSPFYTSPFFLYRNTSALKNIFNSYFKSQNMYLKLQGPNNNLKDCFLYLTTGEYNSQLNTDNYIKIISSLLQIYNSSKLKQNLNLINFCKLLCMKINEIQNLMMLFINNSYNKIKTKTQINIHTQNLVDKLNLLYLDIGKFNLIEFIRLTNEFELFIYSIFKKNLNELSIYELNEFDKQLYNNNQYNINKINQLNQLNEILVENKNCKNKIKQEIKYKNNISSFCNLEWLFNNSNLITNINNIVDFKTELTKINYNTITFKQLLIDLNLIEDKCYTEINGDYLNQMVHEYYHITNYDNIFEIIKKNKESSLYKLNLLKNDYYSLGFIIFIILYKLISNFNKTNNNELKLYIDNILYPILELCFIPFYYPYEINDIDNFKHGELISYIIKQNCIKNNIKNFDWIDSNSKKIDNDYKNIYNFINQQNQQRGGMPLKRSYNIPADQKLEVVNSLALTPSQLTDYQKIVKKIALENSKKK
jgi:hypothetical protein